MDKGHRSWPTRRTVAKWPPSTLNPYAVSSSSIDAAAFAGLAVVFALGSLRPTEPSVAIVVARHDLRAGSSITSGDLASVRIPPAARPAHSTTDKSDFIGRRVAAPMRDGEALTDFRVLAPGLLTGYGEDFVLSTIRVADVTELASLRVGDHVNILATAPEGDSAATIIARRAAIVSLAHNDDRDEAPLIVVAVEEKAGLAIATAATRSRMSVLTVS